MTANFGLVVHAAQAEPDEFAIDRARNRTTERSFADARRPDQTQNRAFRFLLDLAHGEGFDDPLLDLFKAVMIFLKNRFGFLQIQIFTR